MSKVEHTSPLGADLDDVTAKQLRNRYLVAEEVLQTERSYVSQLHVLIEKYSKPLHPQSKSKSRHLLTIEQHQLLFGGIEVIYNLNLQLLESLTECLSHWHNSTSVIGNIFIKFGNFFKLYNNYCNSFSKAQKVLVELSTHKHFHKFCENVRKKPESKGSTLKSLLITPIQRIPRYKLLLEQLLKRTPEEHPDRKPVQKALLLVEEVATLINEALRSHETHEFVVQLKERFLGDVDFFAPSRVFVKQGGPFLVKARLNTVGLSGISALDRSTAFASQSSINSDALAASKHASTTTLPSVDENHGTDTPENSELPSTSDLPTTTTTSNVSTPVADGHRKRLQRSRDRMQLTIFLFNDLIVFAVAVHTKYKVFRQIPIDEHFNIAPVEHVDDSQKYALQVSSNQRKQQIALSVFFDTAEDLSIWTEYLSTFAREQTTAAIIRAVGTGSVEQTRTLVNNPSIDLNAQDRDGWTPLLYACHQGKEELASLLLESKCMIDLPNSRGETAFQLAFRAGRVSCVDVLLDHGASLLLSDAEGHTTLSVVLDAQMPNLAQRMVTATVHRTLPSSRDSILTRDPSLSLSTTGARWPKEEPNVEKLEVLRRRITQEYVFQTASTGDEAALELLTFWREAALHPSPHAPDDCVVPFIDLDFLDHRAKVHTLEVRESPATVAAKNSHWNMVVQLFNLGASPLFTNEARETPLHLYFKVSDDAFTANKPSDAEAAFLKHYLLFLTRSDGEEHKESSLEGQKLGLLRMMTTHPKSSRVDFNVRDESGCTPIMSCYNSMNVKAFTLLLPVSDLLLPNPDGGTLLHLAASQGFAAVVEELLARPTKHRSIAKKLSEHNAGALIELQTIEESLQLLQRCESHLHLLLFTGSGLMHNHSKEGRRECGAFLTAFFALGTTACEIAAATHISLLALLETHRKCIAEDTPERKQFLHCIRWLHRLVGSLRNSWQEYLPHIPVELTEGDIRGYRPRSLVSALSAILPEIQQHLRGLGASVKAPETEIAEPSMSEVSEKIVAKEALLLLSKDGTGLTALMLAAKHNRIKTVKVLLATATRYGCHDELLNQVNRDKQTALHVAASLGHEDVALFLASEGADAARKDSLDFSAFDYACRAETRDLYLRLQAIVLHQATDTGNLELLHYLARSDTNLNATDEFGRTPLMHACIHNRPECVVFFLERHCDPLLRDDDGWTALMHATYNGSFECMERFLSAVAHGLEIGLDLQTFEDKHTPIMLGVKAGKVDCVSLLLTCGADPTVECNGQTASEMTSLSAMQACLMSTPKSLPGLNLLFGRIQEKLPGLVTNSRKSRLPSSPSQDEVKAGGGVGQDIGSPGRRKKRFFTERAMKKSKSGVRLGRAQTGLSRKSGKQDENCVLL